MDTRSQSLSTMDIEKVFEHFPNELYWHLIIDQEKWSSNNPMAFDEEKSKGYLKAASIALYFTFLTIDLPISVDFIIGLHDIAYHVQEDQSALGLQEEGISGFNPTLSTLEGVAEIIDKIRQDVIQLSFVYTEQENFHDDSSNLSTFFLNPNKKSKELAQEILDFFSSPKITWAGLRRSTSIADALKTCQDYIVRYEKEINAAKNDLEKIAAIVKLIHDLHQYHPFADGNGRIFIFLLLNKLLIQNHLSPSTVKIPARFTAYSTEQLIKEVILGQTDFINHFKDFEKNTPILDYILQMIGLTEEDKLKALASIDIKTFCNLFEGQEYVKNNPWLFTNIFAKIYDKESIDLIFKKIPHFAFDWGTLFATSGYFANENMVYKIIDERFSSSSASSVNFISDPFYMDFIIQGLTTQQLENLFQYLEQKFFPFKEKDIIQMLFNKVENDGAPLFTRLLIKKPDSLKFLLNKLEKNLLQLISQDLDGANGLQLLAALNPTLFELISTKLNNKEIIILLLTTPIHITNKALSAVEKFDFNSLISKINIKPQAQILQQHGLYQLSQQSNKQKEDDESFENKNKP